MADASDLVPSYSFEVTLDGVSFSFTKVTNLSGSIEIDTIVEGGSNNSPVILRKPKRSPDMLVLEKGVQTTFKDVAMALFTEGSKISAININVLRNGKIVRMFFVTGGVVVRREFSPLDALESAVLLESLQIAHTGITEVPLPVGL
ncbi:MAG: phage tail protein [Lachnospiraceae bacterium]|nr:phage tail protein [Lachnospiraceae bacterium]